MDCGSHEDSLEKPYQNLGYTNEPPKRGYECVAGGTNGPGVHIEVPARASAALQQERFSTTSAAGMRFTGRTAPTLMLQIYHGHRFNVRLDQGISAS